MNCKIFAAFFLFSFITGISSVWADSGPRCFSKDELVNVARNNYDANAQYFKRLKWREADIADFPFSEFFDYEIDWEYTSVAWEKMDEGVNLYGNEIIARSVLQRIVMLYAPGKPSIIVFYPEVDEADLHYTTSGYIGEDCYRELRTGCVKSTSPFSHYELRKCSLQSTLFEFRDYESGFKEIIIYNDVALEKELTRIKDAKEAIERAERERVAKIQALITAADDLFRAKNFILAEEKYSAADMLEASQSLKSKIESCKLGVTSAIKAKGDSLFEKGEYTSARAIYTDAKSKYTNFNLNNELVKAIKDCDIAILKGEAQTYYKEKNLDMALKKYREIIALDKTDKQALERIELISNILDFLNSRGANTYSYADTNTDDFETFSRQLLQTLNTSVDAEKNGQFTGRYTIAFDTTGRNNSSLDNVNTTISQAPFRSVLSNAVLNPTVFYGYNASSKEIIDINSKWTTSISDFEIKKYKLIYDSGTSEVADLIISQTKSYSIYQGSFKASTKTKTLNGKTYTDVQLLSYKPVGPSVALYSVFAPGLGLYKVTSGNKGKLRFESFITAAGIALGAHFYSESVYKKYLESTSPADMDSYYSVANISHKLSLLSAGVAASIYVYELVDVVRLGFKNIKMGRNLRNDLQRGPKTLKYQPFDKF